MISVEENHLLTKAIKNNFSYICEETLALNVNYKEVGFSEGSEIHLIEDLKVNVVLEKR